RRRGILDCKLAVAANLVCDLRGKRTAGWVETFLPTDRRSIAVLVSDGAPPPVSIAQKGQIGEARAFDVLTPEATLAMPGGGQVLFFDAPVSALQAAALSVVVRPSSPGQLVGVFGLATPSRDAQAAWSATPPTPDAI